MEDGTTNGKPGPWLDMHAHSSFSDGDLSPQEIVELAVERGLKYVGITDHLFTHIAPVHVVGLDGESAPELDDETLEMIKGDAVSDRGFAEYLEELERVRAAASETGITIFTGGELDFLAAEDNAHLIAGALNRLDFLLVENVHGGNWQRFKSFLELMKIPVGLAHIEISSAFPEVPPKMLASALADAGVFVELNAASLWRVESIHDSAEYFRELARRELRFSFGSDLHGKKPMPNALKAGWDFVTSNGLQHTFQWVLSLSPGRDAASDSHGMAGVMNAEESSVEEGGNQN